MKFKQPFYVSIHAVNRFRERVADLPTKTIRTIILSQLQDNEQEVHIHIYNHKPCPIYKAKFRDVVYFIPVIHEKKKKDSWPVVPTILLPGMKLYSVIGKKFGFNWEEKKHDGK